MNDRNQALAEQLRELTARGSEQIYGIEGAKYQLAGMAHNLASLNQLLDHVEVCQQELAAKLRRVMPQITSAPAPALRVQEPAPVYDSGGVAEDEITEILARMKGSQHG